MNLSIVWLNLEYYTPLQLILFGIGAVLWLVNYGYLIHKVFKEKFVEMPAAVLCANFAWEFIWGFVFTQNMGAVLGIGYKLWFFLDCFIIYGFYRYGDKQVTPSVVPYFRSFFTFALLGWGAVLYFFVKQGADNPIGATSAYVINILISSLYIFLFLRTESKNLFSFTTAWTKCVGTGLISVMCALVWPENMFLLSMCVICFLLDVFYIYLFVKLVRH